MAPRCRISSKLLALSALGLVVGRCSGALPSPEDPTPPFDWSLREGADGRDWARDAQDDSVRDAQDDPVRDAQDDPVFSRGLSDQDPGGASYTSDPIATQKQLAEILARLWKLPDRLPSNPEFRAASTDLMYLISHMSAVRPDGQALVDAANGGASGVQAESSLNITTGPGNDAMPSEVQAQLAKYNASQSEIPAEFLPLLAELPRDPSQLDALSAEEIVNGSRMRRARLLQLTTAHVPDGKGGRRPLTKDDVAKLLAEPPKGADPTHGRQLMRTSDPSAVGSAGGRELWWSW